MTEPLPVVSARGPVMSVSTPMLMGGVSAAFAGICKGSIPLIATRIATLAWQLYLFIVVLLKVRETGPTFARPFRRRGQTALLFTEIAAQSPPDDLLRLRHDATDQLRDRRDVVDQSYNHAATPGAGIHVAVAH